MLREMGSTSANVMTMLFRAFSLLQIIFIPFSSLYFFCAFLGFGFGFVLVLAACFCHSFSGEENNLLFFLPHEFCFHCSLWRSHAAFVVSWFFLPFISFSVFVSPFNRGLLLVEICMKWIATTTDEFQWVVCM